MTTAPRDIAASTDAPPRQSRTAGSAKAGLIRFVIGSALVAFVISLTFRPHVYVSAFLLHRQDRWLLLIAAGLVALCCVRLPVRRSLPVVRTRTWLIAALALLIVTYVGHFRVLDGYDFSRDEQMASFDAAVFASGHLVAPLPAFWRDHADALNTLFMYPAPHRAAMISDYLPLNAALRALFSLVGMAYLVGALITATGALALWGCVRRLWPEDREAGLVALVLYAGSAQVLFAGMTSYAMPDHLALNLVWLWLFLRRKLASDMAALAVGFAATGLHQPLMHPIFVAPFVAMLLVERRWGRAGLFVFGYGAITLAWMAWPGWMWTLSQDSAGTMPPAGVDFVTRLAKLLHDRDPMALPNMFANLLRFIAWQHVLLVPLMLIGARTWRSDPMIAALAGGLVLTTLTMAAIMPNQGTGFGYRYLHGLIGNAILLAIYGWKTLGPELGQWRALLVRTSAAGALVLIPLQAWMAHEYYASAAQTAARIGAIDADYAVIGSRDALTSDDFVLNPPWLDRRPLRLLRDQLDPRTTAAICRAHPSVALVGDGPLAPIADYYALERVPLARINAIVAPYLAHAGCRVRVID